MKDLQKIGFGGGCHWCTEAVFQALTGVSQVDQGFMMSDPPHDSWSEAVGVTFDPGIIPLEVLTEIHLRTHASTSNHKMRGKYRSAVYVFDENQSSEVQRILLRLQAEFDEPLVTQVLDYRGFRASEERFQNYHLKNAERPFCQTYIDPKLALLKRNYRGFLQGSSK
ncbi:peptide methionine sulfoxide reductase MsrA [Roseibium sp. TrichSKD4]|uniref:peptide-methionine (S)-S-oxide reductase n=1 Tax=Roseibium sp. TrichSKD4 TaxID=744980 RepID=UPI0001E56862|nr:peptide-methionine (S)-S-oxide reductase [Roseibium sp. TrichSKD4]EFO30545.1 peptide methionine sulfoxide reductase MsrA [Roseibium sp. TrichSKD4]